VNKFIFEKKKVF